VGLAAIVLFSKINIVFIIELSRYRKLSSIVRAVSFDCHICPNKFEVYFHVVLYSVVNVMARPGIFFLHKILILIKQSPVKAAIAVSAARGMNRIPSFSNQDSDFRLKPIYRLPNFFTKSTG